MRLEDIMDLPVPSLANPDGCHVYLWVTQSFLPDAFRCFEAWGVRYHCLLTWVKHSGMTPFSWMFNTEHALFGYLGGFAIAEMGHKVAFEGSEPSRESPEPQGLGL
jgi:N6-adenosine-specific RNA methylase IME4